LKHQKQNPTRPKSVVLLILKLLIFIHIPFFSVIQIEAQPTDFLKARAFELKNQPDSAIYYFNKAINSKPSEPKLLVFRGNLYLLQLKTDLALNDFIAANKLYSGIADFELAKLYAQKFDTTNTIKYLKRHLESSFKQPQATIRLNPLFIKFENSKAWKDLWSVEWYDKYEFQVGEAHYMLNNHDYIFFLHVHTAIWAIILWQ
jgi:tetratricopeptide (TPR) repeat protein